MHANSVPIAVIPFRNLSSDSDTEFFATGFVEDLTADLMRFSSLRVLASQSTFGLSQIDRSVDEVASDWDLQYLLEGSARRGGSTLRVGVQLVRLVGRQTI
jgi:adenylate cyclase